MATTTRATQRIKIENVFHQREGGLNIVQLVDVEKEQHNGQFVDYDHVYTGMLSAAKHNKRTGWKVTSKHTGEFMGLLDLNKLAVWYVDEDSLVEETELK